MKQVTGLLKPEGVHVFHVVKVYAVEIASTLVFLVFIGVETINLIHHLIGGIR